MIWLDALAVAINLACGIICLVAARRAQKARRMWEMECHLADEWFRSRRV